MPSAIPDETEIQAQVDALRLRCVDLECKVKAAGRDVPPWEGEPPSDVMQERDQLADRAEQLEKALASSQSGATQECERHPWRWAIPTRNRRPKPLSEFAGVTATEKVLAAKGVATLEDLKKKLPSIQFTGATKRCLDARQNRN